MSKNAPKNITRWALQRTSNISMNMIALASVLAILAAAYTIGFYKGDRARQQLQINGAFVVDVCRDKPDFMKCINYFSAAVNKPFDK